MKNSLEVRRAILSLILAFAAFPAAAQISGLTARQSSSGSLKFLAYYQGVADQNLNFSVSNSGVCTAAPPNGGVAFPCNSSGDIEAKGSGSAVVMKLAAQLGDYVQPYALIGGGDYALSVPSTTLTNTLTGSRTGLLYGGGVKFSVVPDTQFDTAIALDLGVTQSSYDFDRISPGGTPAAGPIDQRLTLTTYQLAVEASHLFTLKRVKLEPYGGVKWIRVEADLKDLPSGSHAGGKKDAASPFLGMRWPAGDRYAGFAEASFVGGYHYGAGFEMRFN